MIWRLLDPILLRFRSRLRHLDGLHRSAELRARLREQAAFDDTVGVGETTTFDSGSRPEAIAVAPHCFILGEIRALTSQAAVSIGHHSFLGAGSRIWATETMRIGSFVFVSHLVDILDNDSHSPDFRIREQEAIALFESHGSIDYREVARAPIVIEDYAWIGAKSTILKGVTIGRGAMVAASSVVTRSVAPFTMVAGNPARVIGQLPGGASP